MEKFEVQFDLKGALVIQAENYEKAEHLAKQKIEHYKESMRLHFQKKVELNIDDVEKIS
jgi:hypothetical protein